MKVRMALAALTLVTLGASIAPALAEVTTETATTKTALPAATNAEVELPRFVPSVSTEVGTEPSVIPFQQAIIQPLPEEETAREITGGVASWYGAKFAGRKTASGERFNPREYTAAHRSLPFGSMVRVTRGERSVVVRINDRGPFHGNRVIDLSQAAAEELGIRNAGSGRVELAILED